MNAKEALGAVERVLEKSRIAVLSTVDSDGAPHMRWLTPGIVRGRDGFLYAVTSPQFDWPAHLAKNPRAEWLLQTRAMDQILNIRGTIEVLDNPAVFAEVLEAIGPHLTTFWRVNTDETSLIVLETVIEEMSLFHPLTNERQTVAIGGAS